MGTEGGKALYHQRGKAWMREIGRRGFAALVNRHFGGDHSEAVRWLHAHAAESQVARLLADQDAAGNRLGHEVVRRSHGEADVGQDERGDPSRWPIAPGLDEASTRGGIPAAGQLNPTPEGAVAVDSIWNQKKECKRMSFAIAVAGRRYAIDPRLRAKYGAKAMPSQCIPDEVAELSSVRDLIAGQLDADRELLKLHYSLDQAPPDDAPPDPVEVAVLDGERRLEQTEQRIHRALKNACSRCPNRNKCPARLF